MFNDYYKKEKDIEKINSVEYVAYDEEYDEKAYIMMNIIKERWN